MRRLPSHPWLALGLLLAWLALNRSVEPAQILVGGVLALAGSEMYARLGPHPLPRRAAAFARLSAIVFLDVVLSNLAVAKIVFGPARASRRPGFLHIPLDTRHPGALAALSTIVTATPGTTWAGYDDARKILTIHVLDLADEEGTIRAIKARYEQPLREIFE